MSNQKAVYVRDALGRLVRFALLDASENAVFVCREGDWESVMRGERPRPLSGFPIEDAFEAPDNLAPVLDGRPDDYGLKRFANA